MLDWTIALFFRPDITKVGLAAERDERRRDVAAPSPDAQGSFSVP
jgi:hypothetical protein